MATRYTKEDLAKMSVESKDLLIVSMQDQLDKLNENIETDRADPHSQSVSFWATFRKDGRDGRTTFAF